MGAPFCMLGTPRWGGWGDAKSLFLAKTQGNVAWCPFQLACCYCLDAQVMWECLSRKIPFEDMPALAAAMNVATLGMRPAMPPGTDPTHARLIRECWAPVPDQRPAFTAIVARLEAIAAATSAAPPLPHLPPNRPSAGVGPNSGAGSGSVPSNTGQTVLSAASSEEMPLPLGSVIGNARTTSTPEAVVPQQQLPIALPGIRASLPEAGVPQQLPIALPGIRASLPEAGVPQQQPIALPGIRAGLPEDDSSQQPPAPPPLLTAPALVTPRGAYLLPRGGSGPTGGSLMSGDSSSGGRAEHLGIVPLVGPPPRQQHTS